MPNRIPLSLSTGRVGSSVCVELLRGSGESIYFQVVDAFGYDTTILTADEARKVAAGLVDLANTIDSETAGTPIKCGLCEATVASVPAAIAEDWEPSYFVGDEQCTDAVCPKCRDEKLRLSDDGEMELITSDNDHRHAMIPTPLKFTDLDLIDGISVGPPQVTDANGSLVCHCPRSDAHAKKLKEVVHIVNCHDALVAALNECEHMIRSRLASPDAAGGRQAIAVMNRARRALAKAIERE